MAEQLYKAGTSGQGPGASSDSKDSVVEGEVVETV
jgi:hypothetical protein